MSHPIHTFERIHAAVRKALARKPMTQGEIAALLGVTHQRVHQIESNALWKLRQAAEKAFADRVPQGDAA